jgi:hypothetical protein
MTAKWDDQRGYWSDPHEVKMSDILINARKLIAEQDYSVRDALYTSAVNGESDSAAVKIIFHNRNYEPVMPKEKVLAIFDQAIKDVTP